MSICQHGEGLGSEKQIYQIRKELGKNNSVSVLVGIVSRFWFRVDLERKKPFRETGGESGVCSIHLMSHIEQSFTWIPGTAVCCIWSTTYKSTERPIGFIIPEHFKGENMYAPIWHWGSQALGLVRYFSP